MNSKTSVVDPTQVRAPDKLTGRGCEVLLNVCVVSPIHQEAAQDIADTIVSPHQPPTNRAGDEVEALGVQLRATLGGTCSGGKRADKVLRDLVQK